MLASGGHDRCMKLLIDAIHGDKPGLGDAIQCHLIAALRSQSPSAVQLLFDNQLARTEGQDEKFLVTYAHDRGVDAIVNIMIRHSFNDESAA